MFLLIFMKEKHLGLSVNQDAEKATCGKTCLGMIEKSGGEVLFMGQDVHSMKRREHFEFTKKFR